MVGKSRSATIVAAYLLKKYRYSLSDVMTLLTRKREIVKSFLFRSILILASSNNLNNIARALELLLVRIGSHAL
jgi:protein-tyrosine phosphatase